MITSTIAVTNLRMPYMRVLRDTVFAVCIASSAVAVAANAKSPLLTQKAEAPMPNAATTQHASPPPAIVFPTIKPTLKTLRSAHPRLVFTPELEASLHARLKTDPLLAQFVERVRARSAAIAAEPPVPFVIKPMDEFGQAMLPTSRAILERVVAHGFMYRLTGERVYVDRLWREVDTALNFPTWNPAHLLDASEMLLAISFAYDWVYDAWTPEQRARMREAMRERALKRGLEIYETRTGLSSFFVTATTNWNSVNNTSLLAGALAMAEDEPEIAQRVISYAVDSLSYPKSSFEPDGASEEGPSYWAYGTDFYTLGAEILKSALGSAVGLLDSKGVARAALFRLNVQAPDGHNYTYADSWPRSGASIGYAILASRFGPAPARQNVRTLLADDLQHLGEDSGTRLLPLIALWLPPPQSPAVFAHAPLDVFFGGVAHLSMFRSAWNDPRAAFLGFKAGDEEHNHNHLDLGSFLFDQAGVRWSTDLGPDDYSLPGYFKKETNMSFQLTEENRHLPHRWSYFRINNYGHSTLTLGGDLQSRTAVAPFIARSSTPTRAFTVANLDNVYPGRARAWRRGVAMNDRAWIAIRDELKGLQDKVSVDWAMLTEADVQIAPDARSATLTRGSETMVLKLAQAPAEARISAAPALPITAQENQNKGVTKILISWHSTVPDQVLEVHLVPASFTRKAPALGKLSGWGAHR